jgi:hypothetical protein
MRSALRPLMRTIIAASILGVSSQADAQQAPASAGFRSPSTATDSLYSSSEADFVVGKTVYLRSSKMLIGTITKTDANHSFPRTFPRPRMKAVLIKRKDGPYEWTPVERIARIYVVKK